MTRDERDSTEAPAEDESATSDGDGGIQAAVATHDATVNGQPDAKRYGRAFLALRLASLVSIASALAFLVTLDVLKDGWIVWGAMALFLAGMGLAGDALLRGTQRMVRAERARA